MARHRPPAETEAFLLEFLEWQRQQRGPDDRLLGKTLRLLARHHQEQGRAPEAEQRSRESLAQLRKGKPESDWEVARAKSELGERLLARGAYAEAEPLLVSGFEALAADPNTPKVNLDDARGRIVKLYEAWGRPQQARTWRGP
jgi:hypothetical protein